MSDGCRPDRGMAAERLLPCRPLDDPKIQELEKSAHISNARGHGMPCPTKHGEIREWNHRVIRSNPMVDGSWLWAVCCSAKKLHLPGDITMPNIEKAGFFEEKFQVALLMETWTLHPSFVFQRQSAPPTTGIRGIAARNKRLVSCVTDLQRVPFELMMGWL